LLQYHKSDIYEQRSLKNCGKKCGKKSTGLLLEVVLYLKGGPPLFSSQGVQGRQEFFGLKYINAFINYSK